MNQAVNSNAVNATAANAAPDFSVPGPKHGADPKGCLITVVNPKEPLPPSFQLKATGAKQRVIIRITGGCKGMTKEASAGMIPFFVNGFRNGETEFQGVAISGGTANRDDNGVIISDMVTTVPAELAMVMDCVALATTPRTDDLYADRRRAGLAVGETALDIRGHGCAIVQIDAATAAGWDADLPTYFNFMSNLKEADFIPAIIAMNGGDITRDEIYEAINRGFSIIAVEGSLRETDAFIAAFRDGDWSLTCAEQRAKLVTRGKSEAEIADIIDPIVAKCKAAVDAMDRSLVSIVPVNDSAALSKALVAHGLLPA